MTTVPKPCSIFTHWVDISLPRDSSPSVAVVPGGRQGFLLSTVRAKSDEGRAARCRAEKRFEGRALSEQKESSSPETK